MNSDQKGKRGEREAAAQIIRLFGVPAKRGQQHEGSEGRDIIVDLPGIHWEVKRTERLRLQEACEQARRDGDDSIPVVLHRANKQPWRVIVDLDDVPELVRILHQYLQIQDDVKEYLRKENDVSEISDE